MHLLDQLFLRVRRSPFLYRFTFFTRVLLAAGFLPTGLVKLLGRRFATIASDESPIGYFFEAMYQSGLFWHFIGLVQVVAALLLLVPRLAHLGAMLFVPVISSIVVITTGLGFQGTAYVTALMLLAALYLCAWDFHRFRPLFTEEPFEGDVAQHRLDPWERAGFTLFTLALLGFFLATRGMAGGLAPTLLIGLGVLGGLVALGRFVWRSVSAEVRFDRESAEP